MICIHKKAFYNVSRDMLWALLLKYDVRYQLLAAIILLYKQSEVYVCVNGIKTKPFSVNVGLKQACVLSSFLFIIYMEKLDRSIFFSSGITFRECNLWHLLFANDYVLLSSNKSYLQYSIDRFSNACLNAWTKIRTAKTKIWCMSRHSLYVSLSFSLSSVISKQIK